MLPLLEVRAITGQSTQLLTRAGQQVVNKTFKKARNGKVTDFEARDKLSQAVFSEEKLSLAQRQITAGKMIARPDAPEAPRDT